MKLTPNRRSIEYSSLRLFVKYQKRKLSEEKTRMIFNHEVCDNEDFKRHISEVSKKLNIPEEIVLQVVTHYFFSILIKLKYIKERIRIVVYQFFYIEQVNPLNNFYSSFYQDRPEIQEILNKRKK